MPAREDGSALETIDAGRWKCPQAAKGTTLSAIREERIGLFLDSISLRHASDVVEMRLDFKRLLALFRQRGRLVRAQYYAPSLPGGGANPQKPLLDWLAFNGFSVVTCNSAHNDMATSALSLAVNISVDAMQLAQHLDHIVLVSQCRELHKLVEALKMMGKRVSVISTLRNHTVPDELRRQADEFLDLQDLRPILTADVTENA